MYYGYAYPWGWKELEARGRLFRAGPGGYAFTVGSGVDNARTGTGGQRADLLGNPILSADRPRGERVLEWLNRRAFEVNALGTFGAQGRNLWTGPGTANVDLAIHKKFPIREGVATQFRFEMFNAFNRVNLNLPDSSKSSVNFMRIITAGDPRILQFALRLMW